MKFLPSQLSYLLTQREARRNLRGFAAYVMILAATIVAYSLLFHVIMEQEGQEHTWLTGFYWTFTVMSTLGFGDITFHSDLGRAFSILVLLSGIILLLIVLPFTFIQSFYAPWLQAQLHTRAPRKIAQGIRNHVIFCRYDEIAQGLIPYLESSGISYVVIDAEPTVAADLHTDGISVIAGSPEAKATYDSAHARDARLVVANLSDAKNTNITLTAREVAPDVTIAALAEEFDSIDVLELSGADHVLGIKRDLGVHLANRVAVGARHAHRIGHFDDLVIAEFPIHGTSLPGRTVRETRLRELTGLTVVGVWERGHLLSAGPDTPLSEHSVPVMIGTEEQLSELDAFFVIYEPSERPVLVIGGGNVGCAASEALRSRGASVTIVDANPGLHDQLERVADRVMIGDASNIDVVTEAGIADAPAVVLTTNDDATNIFLAVYCRKLNAETQIVSRITHEYNLEAIHRAGADFCLSHTSLAVKNLLAIVQNREVVILGEGADIAVQPIPATLVGKSLGESQIGARTGMYVIAIRSNGESLTNPSASTLLPQGGELVMVGTAVQQRLFRELC
ncbi:MAG: NAD-binding protein [Myxococcota bacterium]|nr:NAD-binding protein [Myxococcota bacterium]